MNRYIITEEDICTIRDYVLGAFYEGENKEKIYDLLESQFSVMRSHPYQSERDCPVCGGGLMCHRWCIDRDCGWDSIKGTPVGRLTMNRYIITEEDICTIGDYVLGAFYEGENKEKIYDLLESQFLVMRSHPYQSERDCPVCGGGLMCHRWCIDRDCGWDSIPAGR